MDHALGMIFPITVTESGCWETPPQKSRPSRKRRRPSIVGRGANAKTISASRFACALKHGPPPSPHLHGAHLCNNDLCINPDHLYWEEPSINTNQALSTEAIKRHKESSYAGRTRNALIRGKTHATLYIIRVPGSRFKNGKDRWQARVKKDGVMYTFTSLNIKEARKWRDTTLATLGVLSVQDQIRLANKH